MDVGTALLILALVEGLQLFGLIVVSLRSARELKGIKQQVQPLLKLAEPKEAQKAVYELAAPIIELAIQRGVIEAKAAFPELMKCAGKEALNGLLNDEETMKKLLGIGVSSVQAGLVMAFNEISKNAGNGQIPGMKLPKKIFGLPSELIAPFIQGIMSKFANHGQGGGGNSGGSGGGW